LFRTHAFGGRQTQRAKTYKAGEGAGQT
jgi:hypothetical protein